MCLCCLCSYSDGVRYGLTLPPHRDDPPLPTPTQSDEMACGIPPRQEGLMPLPTAPLVSPPGAGRGPTYPQGSVISPTLFNHFVSDCPISDLDMRSYADDFTLLASAPSIMEAKARMNQLCSSLVRCADGKQ